MPGEHWSRHTCDKREMAVKDRIVVDEAFDWEAEQVPVAVLDDVRSKLSAFIGF